MNSLIHPSYYMIVRREGTAWYFQSGGKVFYNPKNIPISPDLNDRLHSFGLTMSSVAIELFRLNGGRAGYYLANFKDKKYYYCGATWDDVKAVFLMLGIGKKDPADNG